jgi:hypothetical protein
VLALFRNNQIFTAITLALFAILLHLPALFGWIQPDENTAQHAGDLYRLLFGWTAQDPRGSAIVATLLVIIQAYLVNWLVNTSRIDSERNWILPLLYVFVASCISDFQWTSPALAANTFVPLILRQITLAYKGANIPEIAFNTGFYVGMGALLYPLTLWMIPVYLLGFNSLRTFRLRELCVWLVGCWTPGFLGWLRAFWYDRGGEFRQMHLYDVFQFCDFNFSQVNLLLQLEMGLLGLLLLIVLLSFSVYYFKKLMQAQKLINILYWIIFATLLTWLFRDTPNLEHALLAATPVGLLLGMSFRHIRNLLIAEVLFFSLLLAAAMLFWLHPYYS